MKIVINVLSIDSVMRLLESYQKELDNDGNDLRIVRLAPVFFKAIPAWEDNQQHIGGTIMVRKDSHDVSWSRGGFVIIPDPELSPRAIELEY